MCRRGFNWDLPSFLPSSFTLCLRCCLFCFAASRSFFSSQNVVEIRLKTLKSPHRRQRLPAWSQALSDGRKNKMKAALKTQRVSVVERPSVRGSSGSLFSVFLRGCHRFTRFSLSRSHALSGGGGRMALLLIPSAASSIIFISSYMITKTQPAENTARTRTYCAQMR